MASSNTVFFPADNGGGRSGIDRRQFSYSFHIPERRTTQDRRTGKDRRSGKDRRTTLIKPVPLWKGEMLKSGEEAFELLRNVNPAAFSTNRRSLKIPLSSPCVPNPPRKIFSPLIMGFCVICGVSFDHEP